MLGPWLLVAPVFDPGGRVRVYLPPGRWFDFWSGQAIDGPRWLQDTVPLDRLPVYVRDDSLLVRGPEMTRVGQKPWDPVEIDVRVSSSASLNVQGEGAELSIDAHRDGGELNVDLAGRGSVVLRFLSPEIESYAVEGSATNLSEGRSEGNLVLSLRLDGRASVHAR